jgi:hypothetical protein
VSIPHVEYARQGYTPFKRGCPRLDAVHVAAERMDAVSIVDGNVCGRFLECWHERFVVFCDLLQVP